MRNGCGSQRHAYRGRMALSARLQAVLDALPLEPGMRVLEIGAGPGALARAIADRVGSDGIVVACDR